MKLKSSLLAFALASLSNAYGQSYTSTSATTAWNAARWNNTADASPYTSTYTANNAVSFTSGTYSFAGMGASTNVGNVTVASGVSVSFVSTGSTYATGGLVRTINVGTGGLFDLNGNAVSTAAGTGFIKNGDGVFGTGGGAFTGGFTLNTGTVIARGTTGLGSGATNTLTLNGGTLASNNSRDFANTRFGGGITIGGNVQFGELATVVSIAGSSVDLSFANNVSLGSANRKLTLGNNGIQTFSGVISNTGTGGITFAANANTSGRFDVTNTSNTFSGPLTINGGEVRFSAADSFGNVSNDIVIDGGRMATASATSYTIASTHGLQLGATAGSSISVTTSGTLTYNGIAANKTGSAGILVKEGAGVLSLGGVNTYTGDTVINGGTLTLGALGSIDNTSEVSLGTVGTFDVSAKVGGYTVGTLKGSGNVTGALSISTQLAIGNSPGTTNFSSSLTIGSGATYLYELTGGVAPGAGSADLGDVAGALTINTGAILDLVQLGSYTAGNKFTLLAYDGTLTGTFKDTSLATLIDGATFTDAGGSWQILYADSTPGANGGVSASNTYVTITAVPEPDAAVIFGAIGILGILRRRR
ncbi:MAG: hypothetical protein RLZZ214_1709 [Verrucomicrobiota bacterium]